MLRQEEIEEDFEEAESRDMPVSETSTKRFNERRSYRESRDNISDNFSNYSNVKFTSGSKRKKYTRGYARSPPNEFSGSRNMILNREEFIIDDGDEQVSRGTRKNLRSDGQNDHANDKMEKFVSACNLSLSLDGMVSQNSNQMMRAFFNIMLRDKIDFMKSVDPRAIKLLRFNFVKKLTNKRPPNKSKMFLRWKARTDYELQNMCIKKFALQARINHTVAIYRLRWMVERDGRDKRAKLRKYRRVVGAFLHRIERIKRETYSNRNQLQFAFRNIKNRYLWTLNLDLLNDVLSDIFNQGKTLREAFDDIKVFGRRRKQALQRLVANQEAKEQEGLRRLRRNWYQGLRGDIRGNQ